MHPFDELVQAQRNSVRVAHAALLFAVDEYPEIVVQDYLDRLAALGERVRRVHADSVEPVEATRRVLVEEEGYAGDQDDYYDPRNSYLNAVMDRKRGLPITLSALWIDVSARLGWSFEGVNFPGHYLVRCPSPAGPVLIAPFDAGRIVSQNELPGMLASVFGRPTPLRPEHLQPATALGTLTRMLNNLRSAYVGRQAWGKAMRIVERMLAIEPMSEALLAELEDLTRKQAGMN